MTRDELGELLVSKGTDALVLCEVWGTKGGIPYKIRDIRLDGRLLGEIRKYDHIGGWWVHGIELCQLIPTPDSFPNVLTFQEKMIYNARQLMVEVI